MRTIGDGISIGPEEEATCGDEANLEGDVGPLLGGFGEMRRVRGAFQERRPEMGVGEDAVCFEQIDVRPTSEVTKHG